MTKKGALLYQGKTKKVFETKDPERVILECAARGAQNNAVSAKLFRVLESKGVATHFEQLLSEQEMLVKKLAMIPVQVTIRNRVAGGMTKLFGLEEGAALACPVYELHCKSDPLGNPLINEHHLLGLKIATEEELKVIRERSFQVNNILRPFFEERELELIDFTLEFGRAKGKIFLGDELSLESCRLWEIGTGKKLDKEQLQLGLLDGEVTYQDVLDRVLKDGWTSATKK